MKRISSTDLRGLPGNRKLKLSTISNARTQVNKRKALICAIRLLICRKKPSNKHLSYLCIYTILIIIISTIQRTSSIEKQNLKAKFIGRIQVHNNYDAIEIDSKDCTTNKLDSSDMYSASNHQHINPLASISISNQNRRTIERPIISLDSNPISFIHRRALRCQDCLAIPLVAIMGTGKQVNGFIIRKRYNRGDYNEEGYHESTKALYEHSKPAKRPFAPTSDKDKCPMVVPMTVCEHVVSYPTEIILEKVERSKKLLSSSYFKIESLFSDEREHLNEPFDEFSSKEQAHNKSNSLTGTSTDKGTEKNHDNKTALERTRKDHEYRQYYQQEQKNPKQYLDVKLKNFQLKKVDQQEQVEHPLLKGSNQGQNNNNNNNKEEDDNYSNNKVAGPTSGTSQTDYNDNDNNDKQNYRQTNVRTRDISDEFVDLVERQAIRLNEATNRQYKDGRQTNQLYSNDNSANMPRFPVDNNNRAGRVVVKALRGEVRGEVKGEEKKEKEEEEVVGREIPRIPRMRLSMSQSGRGKRISLLSHRNQQTLAESRRLKRQMPFEQPEENSSPPQNSPQASSEDTTEEPKEASSRRDKDLMSSGRVEENSDDSSRFSGDDQSGQTEPACRTRSIYISPRAAMNDKKQWKYVVNAPERNPRIRQIIRVDICEDPMGACSSQITIPFGFRSQCKQKYSKKKLLALDDQSGLLEVDTFFIPTCCVCQLVRDQLPFQPSSSNDQPNSDSDSDSDSAADADSTEAQGNNIELANGPEGNAAQPKQTSSGSSTSDRSSANSASFLDKNSNFNSVRDSDSDSELEESVGRSPASVTSSSSASFTKTSPPKLKNVTLVRSVRLTGARQSGQMVLVA